MVTIQGHNNPTRDLIRTYANRFDRAITLSLLERFRRSAQAASRLACAVVSVVAILLSSTAYAYAPTKALRQISPKEYAKTLLPLNEYKCLEELYNYESHWNYKATNGNHWGIPQGASKWLMNKGPYTQIDWGLRYIKHRYNTPCIALHHFNRYGWH